MSGGRGGDALGPGGGAQGSHQWVQPGSSDSISPKPARSNKSHRTFSAMNVHPGRTLGKAGEAGGTEIFEELLLSGGPVPIVLIGGNACFYAFMIFKFQMQRKVRWKASCITKTRVFTGYINED